MQVIEGGKSNIVRQRSVVIFTVYIHAHFLVNTIRLYHTLLIDSFYFYQCSVI